jgi:hypothetical protein
MSGQIVIKGRILKGKIGAIASHSMYLAGGLDDDSRCEVGIVTRPDGKVLNGQVAKGLYEITLREEFARLNELTGSLTLTSGVQAAAGDKSIMDILEGTVVWEYDSMACPQTIVRLCRGMMKAYVNQTTRMRALRSWNTRTRTKQQDSSSQSHLSCVDTRHSGPTSRT